MRGVCGVDALVREMSGGGDGRQAGRVQAHGRCRRRPLHLRQRQLRTMAFSFRQTVAHCTSASSPGHRVSRRLRPSRSDYFVLKPKHSGFFDTTLDTLLDA